MLGMRLKSGIDHGLDILVVLHPVGEVISIAGRPDNPELEGLDAPVQQEAVEGRRVGP